MAIRVASRVGFDPTIIITIITTIMTLLQNCKKPASKNAAGNMIDDEFDVLVNRRRSDKCPLQFRKAFRENGVTNKEDMNDIYSEMVADAKLNRNAVASMMAS